MIHYISKSLEQRRVDGVWFYCLTPSREFNPDRTMDLLVRSNLLSLVSFHVVTRHVVHYLIVCRVAVAFATIIQNLWIFIRVSSFSVSTKATAFPLFCIINVRFCKVVEQTRCSKYPYLQRRGLSLVGGRILPVVKWRENLLRSIFIDSCEQGEPNGVRILLPVNSLLLSTKNVPSSVSSSSSLCFRLFKSARISDTKSSAFW